jgi:hypothetical protein
LAQWYLKRFSKIFPIEADVDMFYPIVAPHITPRDHELNKIDSALYQEALAHLSFYSTVAHEKKIFK